MNATQKATTKQQAREIYNRLHEDHQDAIDGAVTKAMRQGKDADKAFIQAVNKLAQWAD